MNNNQKTHESCRPTLDKISQANTHRTRFGFRFTLGALFWLVALFAMLLGLVNLFFMVSP